MEYLDVIIVCSPDRYFPQLVMDHLLIQDIPIRLFFSNVKGDGAASARNFAKEMWQNVNKKSRYVLMSDNDIILPRGSLQALIRFLDQHPDFGAISLHRREAEQLPETEAAEPSHVNAGPVLFRTEVYNQITYHNNDGCECQGMSNDVRKLGYRIGYLGSWKYDHIDQTRRNDLDGPPADQIPPSPPTNQMNPSVSPEMAPPRAIEEPGIEHSPSNHPEENISGAELSPDGNSVEFTGPDPDNLYRSDNPITQFPHIESDQQSDMEVNIPTNRDHLPDPIVEHPDEIVDQVTEEMPVGEQGIEAHPYEDPEAASIEEPTPEVDQPSLGTDNQMVHQILETISYQLSELISESKAIRTLLEQRPN